MRSIFFSKGKDAEKLSYITFVTTLGDFLTYFSVIKVVYDIHGNALSAAFGGIGLGSAAAILAGISSPWLKRHINTKNLIVLSQILSFIVVGLLLKLIIGASEDIYSLFTLLFLQNYFSKIFDASKETHTHGLNDESDKHRQIQSVLLSGLYQAQFLGPIIAYLLLSFFTPKVPVFIDLVSFVVSTCLCLTLSRGKTLSSKLSVLNGLKYIQFDSQIRRLFLLRTLGFWVPASFFNMLIYKNAAERLGLGVEFAGVVYSVLGLGALFTAVTLRENKNFIPKLFRNFEDKNLAVLANFGFASVIGLMFVSKNPIWGTFCYLFYGCFVGINAVSTQSIRRYLCSKAQLPEIMGLEILFSFVIQFFLTYLISQYLGIASNPIYLGLFIVIICCLINSLFYFKSDFKKN